MAINSPVSAVNPENDLIPFSVSPQDPNDQLIAFGPSPTDAPVQPDAETANKTAVKASIGLDIPQEDALSKIMAGEEQRLRQDISFMKETEKYNEKLKVLQQLASMTKRPLTRQEIDGVMDPFNKPSDPSSVIEEAYSKKYIGSLADGFAEMQFNRLQETKKELPELATRMERASQDYMNKTQYLEKALQEWQYKVKDQSYAGYAVDFAKGFFQPYSEYMMRNSIDPEAGALQGGLLLGTNVSNQISNLFQKDWDTFKKRVDDLVVQFNNNPQLGREVVNQILNASSSDFILQNVFTVAAIPDAVVGAKIATSVSKQLYNARYMARAFRDHVDASRRALATNPNPNEVNSISTMTPEAAMAEGAGNTHRAAVEMVSRNLTDALEGRNPDPIAAIRYQLTKDLKDDSEVALQGRLGKNLSREAAVRILDEIEANQEKFLRTIEDAYKVNRAPLSTIVKEHVDQILKENAEKFHGPQASLLNQELLQADPLTNTRWERQTIGNYDATIFRDEATAHGFAQNQLGLAPRTVTKPVESGYTRFYATKTDGKIVRVTTDLDYAREYNALGKKRDVSYVDIPNDSPFVTQAQANNQIFGRGEAVGRNNARIELPAEYRLQLERYSEGADRAGYRLVPREGFLTDKSVGEKTAESSFLQRAIEHTQKRIAEAKKFIKETKETPLPEKGTKRFYTTDDGKTLHPTIEEARGKNRSLQFRTAKGSKYEIHEDGTTTRNKAKRPEHGDDEGLKPRSERTVYLKEDAARALATPEDANWRMIVNDDGTATLIVWNEKANRWGISPSQKNIKVSFKPTRGSTPLELWDAEEVIGAKGYKKVHFGNKITKITRGFENEGKTVKYIDIKASSFDKRYRHALVDPEASASAFKSFPGDEVTTKRLKTMSGPEGNARAEMVARLAEDNKLLKSIGARYDEAQKYLQDNLNSYNVRQYGTGFVIERDIPLDLTSPSVLKLSTAETAETAKYIISKSQLTGSKGIAQAIFGRFRTPEDVLSLQENMERKVAAYGKSEVEKVLNEAAQRIQDVVKGRQRFDPVTGAPISWWLWRPRSFLGKISNKQVAEQFQQALEYAQTARDPLTKREGYYFRTFGELDDFYLRNFGRSVSEAEAHAYKTTAWLHEAQRSIMEINEFAHRAAVGAEQFRINFKGTDGKKVLSNFFDGVRQKQFPGGDARILILGKNKGDEVIETLGHNKLGNRLKDMREKVADGRATVIRIYNRDHMPLDEFSSIAKGERISYVYTENGVEAKALEFNHVNRTGGGHWDYAYDFYIKIPILEQEGKGLTPNDRSIKRMGYYGDKTLMPIKNAVMGERIIKSLHEARDALKAGDMAAAETALAPTGIPFEKFVNWFKPTSVDGRLGRPVFSMDEDFRVVPKGKMIIDLDDSIKKKYPDVYEGAKKGSPDLRFKVAYNEERDPNRIWTVMDEAGWSNKPVYQYRPAELTNPITAMNRALNRSVNSLWMNDYKHYAMNTWLETAAPHLTPSIEELRDSPMWYYYNSENMYRSGIKPEIKTNLETQKQMQMKFMGTPSNYDTMLHRVSQWAADVTYEQFGPKASLIPEWLYGHVHEPVNLLRSIAFNAKIGLFSIPQLFVQMQTHANILGIEPKHGSAGTWAQLLHMWGSVNNDPAFIQKLDEMATKMNVFGSRWKPGEFTEARELLRRSGYKNVAGEHALGDNDYIFNYFKSDRDAFLNAGQAFFKLGEKSPRIASFYTSYRKFREANPLRKITEQDFKEILNYADTLTFNMSRASSSAMHTGWASIATQFLAYQMRAIELFAGKRLGETTTERMTKRATLLTAYSALYGIPGTVGLFIYPWGDTFRKQATDAGYVPGNNALSSLLMEGAPALFTAFVTGGGDIKKGNWEDFSGRYGIQGFTQLSELVKTNPDLLKIAGGASISIVGNTLKRLPGFGDILSLASNDPKERGRVKLDDVFDPMREISSVNQAYMFAQALSTGMRINRNEGYVTDTTPLRAFMHSITGLSPTDQSRTYTKSLINMDVTNAQKEAYKEFAIEFQRYMRATQAGQTKEAQDYFNRASRILNNADIPDDMRIAFISRASKMDEPQAEASDRSFYATGKNIPKSKKQQRLDTYRDVLKIRDSRKENN